MGNLFVKPLLGITRRKRTFIGGLAKEV